MFGVKKKESAFVEAMGREMRETFPGFQENPWYQERFNGEEKKLVEMQQKSTKRFMLYFTLLWPWRNLRKRLAGKDVYKRQSVPRCARQRAAGWNLPSAMFIPFTTIWIRRADMSKSSGKKLQTSGSHKLLFSQVCAFTAQTVRKRIARKHPAHRCTMRRVLRLEWPDAVTVLPKAEL